LNKCERYFFRRFSSQGYSVALIARSSESLQREVAALKQHVAAADVLTVAADLTKEEEVKKSFETIRNWGTIEVLIHNASAGFKISHFKDISAKEFEDSWRGNCLSGFLTSKEVMEDMAKRGHGTVIFTGATASLRGRDGFMLLAVGKFGLRALAQSLAREYGPKGVHVAHAVIDGPVDTPRVRAMLPHLAPEALIKPDSIAEMYWFIHSQPKSGWTHEFEIRTHIEKW